jgi:predicted nuclease with TOPRIM domain
VFCFLSLSAHEQQVAILKRKLEEKERSVREAQARLREAEARNRELSEEVSSCEEKVADLRAQADGLKERGASTHGLREQVGLDGDGRLW